MNALVSVRSPQTSFLSTSLVQVDECLGSNNLAFIHTSQRSTKTLKCRRSLIIQASGDGRGSGSTSIFVGGFVLGGLVVGALGCIYAPQVLKYYLVFGSLSQKFSSYLCHKVEYYGISEDGVWDMRPSSETVEISKALAGADRKDLMRKLPKFIYDEEKALERTRKILTEKIAQLNSAIDDVSAQLRADDEPNGAAITADELEASI